MLKVLLGRIATLAKNKLVSKESSRLLMTLELKREIPDAGKSFKVSLSPVVKRKKRYADFVVAAILEGSFPEKVQPEHLTIRCSLDVYGRIREMLSSGDSGEFPVELKLAGFRRNATAQVLGREQHTALAA